MGYSDLRLISSLLLTLLPFLALTSKIFTRSLSGKITKSLHTGNIGEPLAVPLQFATDYLNMGSYKEWVCGSGGGGWRVKTIIINCREVRVGVGVEVGVGGGIL